MLTIFRYLNAFDVDTLTGVNARFRDLATQELESRFARPSNYKQIPMPVDELIPWSGYARLLHKYGARVQEFDSMSTSYNMNMYYGLLTRYCPSLTALKFNCTYLEEDTLVEMRPMITERLECLQMDCVNHKLPFFTTGSKRLRKLLIRLVPFERSMLAVYDRRHPSLESFSVAETMVFPCPELETLSIEYVGNVPPAQLTWKLFPCLDMLHVSGKVAPMASILSAVIVGHIKLGVLALLNCSINRDVLDCFGRLSTVETLVMGYIYPEVNDDTLAIILWHLAKLKSFTMASNQITARGIQRALRVHRGIDELDFTFDSMTRYTDKRFSISEQECDDITKAIGGRKVRVTLFGYPRSIQVGRLGDFVGFREIFPAFGRFFRLSDDFSDFRTIFPALGRFCRLPDDFSGFILLFNEFLCYSNLFLIFIYFFPIVGAQK